MWILWPYIAKDEKCPAKGKSCNKCGGRDHFSKKCRSRKRTYPAAGRNENTNLSVNKTAKIEDHNVSFHVKAQGNEVVKHISVENEEYVFNVTNKDDGSEVECSIGGIAVKGIIDSGSKYNLMSQVMWENLKKRKVKVTNQRKETGKVFKSYGGHVLPVIGVFTAELMLLQKNKNFDFYVIEGDGKLLVGRDTAIDMDVLKINFSVNKIDDQTTVKIGKIKGVVINIPIKTPFPLSSHIDVFLWHLRRQSIEKSMNCCRKA